MKFSGHERILPEIHLTHIKPKLLYREENHAQMTMTFSSTHFPGAFEALM